MVTDRNYAIWWLNMFRELIPKSRDSNWVPAWVLTLEQTTSENQMKGALWTWMPEKASKTDMKVLLKKGLIGNGAEFENDARFKRSQWRDFRSGTEWENRGVRVTTLAKQFWTHTEQINNITYQKSPRKCRLWSPPCRRRIYRYRYRSAWRRYWGRWSTVSGWAARPDRWSWRYSRRRPWCGWSSPACFFLRSSCHQLWKAAASYRVRSRSVSSPREIIIMAEMAVISRGLAALNEGDAYGL